MNPRSLILANAKIKLVKEFSADNYKSPEYSYNSGWSEDGLDCAWAHGPEKDDIPLVRLHGNTLKNYDFVHNKLAVKGVNVSDLDKRDTYSPVMVKDAYPSQDEIYDYSLVEYLNFLAGGNYFKPSRCWNSRRDRDGERITRGLCNVLVISKNYIHLCQTKILNDILYVISCYKIKEYNEDLQKNFINNNTEICHKKRYEDIMGYLEEVNPV